MQSVLSANRILFIIVAMFVLLGISKLKSYQQRRQAIESNVQVETGEQLPVTAKEIRISFEVEDEYPPPLPAHESSDETTRIVFTPDQFDVGSNTYSKTIQSKDVPLAQFKQNLVSKNYAAYRLYVVNPEKEGWAFFGKLTAGYTDASEQTELLAEDCRAWVVSSHPSELPTTGK